MNVKYLFHAKEIPTKIGKILALIILAIPVIFSDKTGFLLCGIAEDPFAFPQAIPLPHLTHFFADV